MICSTVSILHTLGALAEMPRHDVLDLAVEDMFLVADSDGSGLVDAEEFAAWACESALASNLVRKFSRAEAKLAAKAAQATPSGRRSLSPAQASPVHQYEWSTASPVTKKVFPFPPCAPLHFLFDVYCLLLAAACWCWC